MHKSRPAGTTGVMTNQIQAAKVALRTAMKVRRASLTAEHRRAAAAAIAAHGLAFAGLPPGAVISGFLSIGDELDTGPLLARLKAAGHRLCLPVMQGRDKPLLFRAWSLGDAMVTAVWGIREPTPDKPVLAPDFMLVPLLAADRAGHRLGYGGGFYDRTIHDYRTQRNVVTVGLAFLEQLVDAVPHLDYDEPLDWILTPTGAIRCHPSSASVDATSVPR